MTDNRDKLACKFKIFKKKANIREIKQLSDEDDTTVVKIPRKLIKPASALVSGTKKLKTKNSHLSSVTVFYSVGEDAERKNLAIAQNEIDTEHDRDSKAVFERHLEQNKKKVTNDGLYHGMSGYHSYIEKKDNSRGNAASNVNFKGPLRAAENIRVTTRLDYNPSMCKDYKETGFCGFGDSCIFIHDRSDYKYGWEIEEDLHHDHGHEDKCEQETISQTCPICQNKFKNIVKTKCLHYFCEKCALENYRKTKTCFVCDQQTYGIFNPAKEMEKKLAKLEENIEESEDFEDLDCGNEMDGIIHNECSHDS